MREEGGREGGRKGGRERGCRLWVIVLHTMPFEIDVTGSQSGNVQGLTNTSQGSKSEETSTSIESVSLPLYFHNTNI